MGKIMIINGSPRAPKSNSKKYGEIFAHHYKGTCDTYHITKRNHDEICSKMKEYTDILFVFPLYADGIPVTLLNFLKTMETSVIPNKSTVNVLINCGFIEPEQNTVAIDMMKLFCKQNDYTFGSVLAIGGGEAILNTPFKFLAKWKIKQLAQVIMSKKNTYLSVTMPLSKKMYIKASTKYWIEYGKKNGITKQEMEKMKIEE